MKLFLHRSLLIVLSLLFEHLNNKFLRNTNSRTRMQILLKSMNENYVIYNCTNPNQFALSFDDGPNAMTEKHLDLFKRKNIKVTFFFIANRIDKDNSLDIVKRAFNEGHLIGNHNYFHDNITQKLTNKTHQETIEYFKRSILQFKNKLGVAPRYFRPPYGEITDEIAEKLHKIGIKIVLWNLDTEDWYWEKEGRDKLKIVETFTNELNTSDIKSAYISLQHEKSKNVEAEFERLNYIIDLIRMKNFEIVTIDKCLNDKKPYFDKEELDKIFK